MSIAGGISAGAAACCIAGEEAGATETALSPAGDACAAGADGDPGTFSHELESGLDSSAGDGDAAGLGDARSAAGIDSSWNATTTALGLAALAAAAVSDITAIARANDKARGNADCIVCSEIGR